MLPHWHIVADRDVEHVSGLFKFRNIRQFDADLEFFLANYTPVSLSDVIRHLSGCGQLPKRSFMPTFDDGFREVYDTIAPILHRKGIPAVFLLITSAIDNRELCYPQKKSLLVRALDSLDNSRARQDVARALDKAGIEGADLASRIRSIYYRQRHIFDQLAGILQCDFSSYVSSVQPYLTSEQIKRLLAMGFDIGAHSIDHPLYSELELDEQLAETLESMRWLSTTFEYTCQSFAFPYHDADISPEFFRKAFSFSDLQVSFGDGGVLRGTYPKNLPRFGLEKTDLPAAQLVARQFWRGYVRKALTK